LFQRFGIAPGVFIEGGQYKHVGGGLVNRTILDTQFHQ